MAEKYVYTFGDGKADGNTTQKELLGGKKGEGLHPRWLPLGGALSGFLGGLSGHQGALRAVFLTPLGLTPTAFAATQAVLGELGVDCGGAAR